MTNIVGGSIFSSNNRRTCLLKFVIKVLNEKCHGYRHMLQDNPPYKLVKLIGWIDWIIDSVNWIDWTGQADWFDVS